MRVLSVAKSGTMFGRRDPEVVHPRAQRLDRASRIALSAAQEALAVAEVSGAELGVFVITRFGAFAANAEHWQRFASGGLSAVSPLVFPATVPSAAAGEIAIATGAMGPNITLCGGHRSLPELWHMAEAALRTGDCRHALVAAVDGWHEQLGAYGLTPECVDGACVALCSAGDGWPKLVEHVSVVAAFDRSLSGGR